MSVPNAIPVNAIIWPEWLVKENHYSALTVSSTAKKTDNSSTSKRRIVSSSLRRSLQNAVRVKLKSINMLFSDTHLHILPYANDNTLQH